MENNIGKRCPYCKTSFGVADEVVVCSQCEMPHHKDCWVENQGCTTFGCLGTIQGTNQNFGHQNIPTLSIRCSKCGETNTITDKFCGCCGNLMVSNPQQSAQPMPQPKASTQPNFQYQPPQPPQNISAKCSKCGEINSTADKFCGRCGNMLTQDTQPSAITGIRSKTDADIRVKPQLQQQSIPKPISQPVSQPTPQPISQPKLIQQTILIKCSKCGSQDSSEDKFCDRCGNPVSQDIQSTTQYKTTPQITLQRQVQPQQSTNTNSIRCPGCGSKNSKTNKFCLRCGNQIFV